MRMIDALLAAGSVLVAPAALGAATLQVEDGDGSLEAEHYEIRSIQTPDGVEMEVGGLAVLPDGRLAVATRHGEIWMADDAVDDAPTFTRFAHGLHEPLGLAYRDGALYAAQRGELTRLRDPNGDGRADAYETIVAWPLDGNYHEYSYGPVFASDGSMFVTLNLGWIGHGASLSRWRGWTIRVTDDGTVEPFAVGMRSPAALALLPDGELFYAENQGDWVGSGFIAHVTRGGFYGNPAGLRWTDEPGSPLRLRVEDVPDTGEPRHEVAERVPVLALPAVWLPHGTLGISTSDILVDTTGGRFGPFGGQLFIGDQGRSNITRVFLEKVAGEYQGAAFPFRSGFSSGVLRLEWASDGSMIVGMTNRGWGSTGREPFGLQRLVWTGEVPFEALAVEARSDGFEITFTRPVDPVTANDPASYGVSSFTYHYRSEYGSPPIQEETHEVRGIHVSDDGTRVRLTLDRLRQGYVHQISLEGIRSADGLPLLHDTAYYTLNRIP